VSHEEPNLNAGDDNFFNAKTSSIVILESSWESFIGAGHVGMLGRTLGPGELYKINGPAQFYFPTRCGKSFSFSWQT
jgi:hypothetical protein